MHVTQYDAYRSWIEKWKPHIVYGAAASGASSASPAKSTRTPNEQLQSLPGGQIVRAF